MQKLPSGKYVFGKQKRQKGTYEVTGLEYGRKAKELIPRKTPEEDVERLAERIWNAKDENGVSNSDYIEDVDTFNECFDKFFEEDLTERQNTVLRKRVFKVIKANYPSVIAERGFRKAGRPRAKATIEAIEVVGKKALPKFVALRYIENKPVWARETSFVVKDKKRIVYRDRLGKFTSDKPLRDRKKTEVYKVV